MKEEFITGFPLSILKWNRMSRKLALSAQQTRIVELILCNLSDKEIASQLGIKVPTVRTYLQRTYVRMGVEDRMGLVLKILKTSNIDVTTAATFDINRHDSIGDDAATDGLSNYKIGSTVSEVYKTLLDVRKL